MTLKRSNRKSTRVVSGCGGAADIWPFAPVMETEIVAARRVRRIASRPAHLTHVRRTVARKDSTSA